uniref:CSON010859 protein n=1 Tax=Culicoides sonorensis TaxID=179676 RepID=A0A336M6J1_CULSO
MATFAPLVNSYDFPLTNSVPNNSAIPETNVTTQLLFLVSISNLNSASTSNKRFVRNHLSIKFIIHIKFISLIDLIVDPGLPFTPVRKLNTKTSTPMKELFSGVELESIHFSGSPILNQHQTLSNDSDSSGYNSLSQISHVSSTQPSQRSRHTFPRHKRMPPRPNTVNQTVTRPSGFVMQTVPNYRSSVQRPQPYANVRIQPNYPELNTRDVQSLSFALGNSDILPDPELPDNDEEQPVSEEEQKIADYFKEMLEKGEIPTWEQIQQQLSNVRDKYGRNNDAAYFHDRSRVMNRLETIYESLKTRPGSDQIEENPRLMTTQLKSHQKAGLKFMLWRETQEPPGGILADDMGLGKTMAVVALVSATLYKTPRGNLTRPPGVRYTGHTLVICPPSLTVQWADEFLNNSTGIRVLVHHGATKAKRVEELLQYNVVVTSYHTVCSERKSGSSMLYRVFWSRIVLDEGHLIRNHAGQHCEAICHLHGKIRWILTGTPIHNRVDDVFSYLIFLRCDPFDERTIFLKWAKQKEGMGRLNVILKAFMLRRTKEELKTVSGMKIIETFEYELEPKEFECYKRLMLLSQSMMKVFLNHRAHKNGDADLFQGKELYNVQKILRKRLNGYITASHIFVLLLRLRQLCSHPALISTMLTKLYNEENTEHDEELDYDEQDTNVMGLIINDAFSEKDIFTLKNEIFDEERPSTKIRMLMHVLQERFMNTKDKALIICEWTSYLKIIAEYLSLMGLSYEFYTGEEKMEERPEIIRRFNTSDNPRVLLLSLKCGGVGLNLAKANHVFFMCTHWNPQNHTQAEDRCYRIGQEKDVYIYKFRAQGTIEERIHELQQIKLKLAEKMLTGASANNYRLTMNDIKSLFGI